MRSTISVYYGAAPTICGVSFYHPSAATTKQTGSTIMHQAYKIAKPLFIPPYIHKILDNRNKL